MKIFLKTDFYFQILAFFIAFFTLVLLSIFSQKIQYVLWFPSIVGILQLFSFAIRFFLKYRKSLFYILYGLSMFPIAIYVLYESIQFSYLTFFDVWILVPIWGLLISPVMSFFYLFYCHETIKYYEEFADQTIEKFP